jgi:hypothetical protein
LLTCSILTVRGTGNGEKSVLADSPGDLKKRRNQILTISGI